MHLRPRREGDRDVLFAHQADPASAAMAGVPARDRAAFDAHWEAYDPSVRRWVVEAAGAVVGEAPSFVRGGEREVGHASAASTGAADWPSTPLDPVAGSA